ncbi:tubby-like F-box protein 6 isoform X2 [Impatiens glandulifera]|uniref:tubby-like F-box protein 6 isoform X2 n=1 Tax=Impatiens glandulifera TaxID=253017 RepID=UPI001FB1960D|nr:tubby-like F-box protein 6 isoform X2 [Impatiens glandulifera]
MKFDFRYRSNSIKVVQDCPLSSTLKEEEKDWMRKSCCWSNIPQELLREVLVRIEASESSWPLRKNVVACAGVCRNWRGIMKEIVRMPEICGKLTFPISVKQPGPRESILQCFIRRNPSAQTYRLYLNLTQDDGKFLLASRKFRHATCTDYMISLHSEDMSRGSSTYVGKIRTNFLGTKFTIYDGNNITPPHIGAKMSKSCSARLVGLKQVSPRTPPAGGGNYQVAHISYELNMLGSRGPRKMNCVMDSIPASSSATAAAIDSLPLPFSLTKSSSMENYNYSSGGHLLGDKKPLVLKNKSPRWHEQLQCWCLNFHGRVTVASVKNFQLVASVDENNGPQQQQEEVILQFGKVGKDVFTMDYRYPISAFQAFAISLTSFDTKIACE